MYTGIFSSISPVDTLASSGSFLVLVRAPDGSATQPKILAARTCRDIDRTIIAIVLVMVVISIIAIRIIVIIIVVLSIIVFLIAVIITVPTESNQVAVSRSAVAWTRLPSYEMLRLHCNF